MKILHCIHCNDMVALHSEDRTCRCGRSGGRYIDRVWAEYRGPSRILGMLNQEVSQSLRDTHVPFEGPHYRWFVITEGGNIRRSDGVEGEKAFEAAVLERTTRRELSLDALAQWVIAEAKATNGERASNEGISAPGHENP